MTATAPHGTRVTPSPALDAARLAQWKAAAHIRICPRVERGQGHLCPTCRANERAVEAAYCAAEAGR